MQRLSLLSSTEPNATFIFEKVLVSVEIVSVQPAMCMFGLSDSNIFIFDWDCDGQCWLAEETGVSNAHAFERLSQFIMRPSASSGEKGTIQNENTNSTYKSKIIIIILFQFYWIG